MSLRIALASVRDAPLRSVAVVLLIAIPVAGLTWFSSVMYTDSLGRPSANVPADWPITSIAVTDRDQYMDARELIALLPPGVSTQMSGTAALAAHVTVDAWAFSRYDLIDTRVDGNWPQQAGEIVLAESTANELNLAPGDLLPDGRFAGARVTGLLPHASNGAWVTIDEPGLASILPGIDVRAPREVFTAELGREFRAVLGRDSVWFQEFGWAPAGPSTELPFVVSLGSVVLTITGSIVWGAMAFGVRRRIRDVGLMTLNGASTRHFMTMLTVEGFVLGSAGSIAGLATGLLATTVLRLEYGDIAFNTVGAGASALLGIAAAALASALAGRTATQTPVAAARMGRTPEPEYPRYLTAFASIAAFVGLGFAVVAAYDQNGASLTPAVGLTAIGGLGLAPALLSVAADQRFRFRGTLRIALGDLARHRSRNLGVVLVLAPILAVSLALTYAQVTVDESSYGGSRNIITQQHTGMPSIDEAVTARLAAESPTIEPFHVSRALPTDRSDTQPMLTLDDAAFDVDAEVATAVSIVDPSDLEAMGIADGADILRDGGGLIYGGDSRHVGTLTTDDSATDVAVWSTDSQLGELADSVVVSEITAAALGLAARGADPDTRYWYISDVASTIDARIFDLAGVSTNFVPPLTDLSQLTTNPTTVAPLSILAGVAAVVVGAVIGLVKYESGADTQIMTALGAPPSAGRTYVAWTLFLDTLITSLLAVFVTIVIVIAIWAGRPWVTFVRVPWRSTLTLVLFLPAAIGLLGLIFGGTPQGTPQRRSV